MPAGRAIGCRCEPWCGAGIGVVAVREVFAEMAPRDSVRATATPPEPRRGRAGIRARPLRQVRCCNASAVGEADALVTLFQPGDVGGGLLEGRLAAETRRCRPSSLQSVSDRGDAFGADGHASAPASLRRTRRVHRRERRAPERAGIGRAAPPALRPKTLCLASALVASRPAPWTETHATSPAANSPGTSDSRVSPSTRQRCA